MLWFYRIICGQLHIRIYGTGPERLLNIAASNRLGLRCVKVNRDGIYAVMPVNKFCVLRKLIRKTGIRIHIIQKKGIIFFLKKHRERAGFITGLVLFCIILKFLSGFIWTVNVVGNKTVETSKILKACRNVGVYEGVRSSQINTTNGPQEMLISMPELAWGSFNIENCILTVNVTEVKKTDRNKNNGPSNLRATSDGIITGIDVSSGNVLVKIGDVVSKGDLLVSGVLETADSSVFVHSEGEVTAQIQKSISVSGYFDETIKVPTGEKKQRTVLDFYTIKIPLYVGNIDKPNCSKLMEKQLYLFGNRLPFGVTVRKFTILKEKRIKHNYDELVGILQGKIEEKCEKLYPDGAEIIYEGIYEDKEKLTLERIVSVNEKISAEDLILFDTIN